MQFLDVIKKRRSIRRYSDKKPDWRKIIKAMDAARFAPMAGNLFSVRFILIKDEQKIKELKEACQQDFVGKAHYIVAVVSENSQLVKSYGERADKYGRQQAGAAIQNFLLALIEQGLATCWTGYFADEQVKRILGAPDDATVEALFPIGIETKVELKEKQKVELENILFFDKFGNKYMEPRTRTQLESV